MTTFPSNKSCPRCKGEMQYICLTSYPPQYKARCLYCGYEEGNTIQKQTNADRIRAMTDEELAEACVESVACFVCPMTFDCDGRKIGKDACKGKWFDWLKQEVKGEKIMHKKIVGKRYFKDSVDVTDPCYDKDVWCRLNDIKIVSGEYDCVVWLSDEGEWGIRVSIIGIYLAGIVPSRKEMSHIGEIGVDAGLAGFFENKPDYSDAEWAEFCRKVGNGNAWILEDGFCSSSGYGVGEYDVFAKKLEDGRAVALEIRFL